MPPGARAYLACVVARHLAHGRDFWVSAEHTADALGVDRRQVRRWENALVQAGLLTRRHDPGRRRVLLPGPRLLDLPENPLFGECNFLAPGTQTSRVNDADPGHRRPVTRDIDVPPTRDIDVPPPGTSMSPESELRDSDHSEDIPVRADARRKNSPSARSRNKSPDRSTAARSTQSRSPSLEALCADVRARWPDAVVPRGQLATHVLPLVRAHTLPVVRTAWQGWLTEQDPQFFSPSRFPAAFSERAGRAKPAAQRTNGKHYTDADFSIARARKRTSSS